MSFYLVRLDPNGEDGYTESSMPDYGPYEAGSEAAKVAKELSFSLGAKIQPRRIAQAPDWRARQKERMENGTYKLLPKGWDLDPIDGHFAHIWANNGAMIAFTESDEKGIIDRLTVLKPGGYISRFYPEVSEKDMRRLISVVDPNGMLFLARTPEEIEKAYRTGPGSCMSHPKSSNWPNHPVHPVRAYGAGDLAVAYTQNAAGKIQSRCIVWPDRKQHGRIYGDLNRMQAALQAEGYKAVSSFVGAKMLLIPFGKSHPAHIVLPYFDNIAAVRLEGDNFVTIRSDDVKSVPGMVFASSGGTAGMAILNEFCERRREWGAHFQFKTVHTGIGKTQRWSEPAHKRFASTCPVTGELWQTTSMGLIYLDGDVRSVSPVVVRDDSFVCAVTGNRYHNKHRKVLASGKIVNDRVADEPVSEVSIDPVDAAPKRRPTTRKSRAKKAVGESASASV